MLISSPLQITAVGLTLFEHVYKCLQYSNASELSLVGFTCRHMFMFFFALCARIGLERKEGGRDAARDRG